MSLHWKNPVLTAQTPLLEFSGSPVATTMPELAPWQWITGAFCAFAIGVAKTGVPGAGTFVAPAMILMVGDARQAAGWLLPVLCLADGFAVFYWRRHADLRQLLRLAPWVLIGMAGGAAALTFNESVLRKIVAGIIFAMLAVYLRGRLRPETAVALPHASPYGIAAGFSTTVANAAGAVMNLYLLSMRLPKHEFIATAAWFFFVINLAKIPIYQFHGLFSRVSLLFDTAMIPATIAGALTGRWIFAHIPQRAFEIVVLSLTLAATLALLH